MPLLASLLIRQAFDIKRLSGFYVLFFHVSRPYPLYDPELYELASVNGFLETASSDDVAMLNEHQILNYHANLYARDANEHPRPRCSRPASARHPPARPRCAALCGGR